MSFERRRRAALFVLSISLGSLIGLVALGAAPVAAGSQATTNACLSNATATYSDLDWVLSGTADPTTATAGDTITLGASTVEVEIPATLLIAGYNLGLLVKGANDIPTKVFVARAATNATPSVQVDSLELVATTSISDPDGTPGTGDEGATPLAVSEPLPDMVVTTSGGDVAFSQAAPGTLPQIPAGVAGNAAVQPNGSLFASASVAGGLIRANFDCFPGNTVINPPGGTSGTTFTPATPTPFEVASVSGTGSSTTTSTSTTSTSTTSSTSTSTSTTTTSTTMPTTTTTTASSPTTATGTATYDADCTNSVTPDISVLTFAVTGTAPSEVIAGDPVTLSGQSWKVTVPGSVLDTGLGLELLQVGQTVAGTATVAIFASNTVEGTVASTPTAIELGPIALGGDGKAAPADTTFAVKDMTWTSTGGVVGYGMASTAVQVEIGPLKVDFNCEPQDETLTIVETSAVGNSGLTPASRAPTTSTPTAGGPAEVEVLGETTTGETTSSLPKTGAEAAMLVLIAIVLLDLGYLASSVTRERRSSSIL